MKKARETKTRYKTNSTIITLDKELVERLRYAAEWKGIPFEEAASNAVAEYLGHFGIEKIRAEQAVFEKMRSALLRKYRGQYVAVHNGEVVEHAPDLRSLHHRVFVRFGFTPILHIQVTDEPLPDIRTHGLRLERSA